MNEMHNPPHPGLPLRDGAISPAMALRIERWLGRDRGGAAEVWLAQQTADDLWQARVTLKKSKTLQAVKSAAKRAA